MKLFEILSDAMKLLATEYKSGDFNCAYNKLTSLKGVPVEIGENFNCSHNQLTSLERGPKEVGGYFHCFDNKLTSLKGAPTIIGVSFDCSENQLTSLGGIHKIIKKMKGSIYANGNPIKSQLLGVLLIDGCCGLFIDDQEVESIINKYLPNTEGMAGVLKCQEELFAADLDEYAQL